ncbi:tripartite tricarboxylate transporter TctB family protein [Marinovum sp.]|uniref:tripartite tricarboxylate transporter TctB family protein n=1 Tax=Marinovum sp. TaxID=2024839 RepID=UPI002B2654FF|nr:tripartite tricarboxylate transporter TctB family protein [Marinovum sp.]
MRIADRLSGSVLALFGLLVIWGSTRLPQVPGVRFGADLLPLGLGIALLGFGLIIALSSRRDGRVWINLEDWRGKDSDRRRDRLAAIWSLGGLALGLVLFEPLGFPLYGMGFMAVMMALMGARWPVIALICPGFILLLHYVFSGLLRVSLPAGPLAGILS